MSSIGTATLVAAGIGAASAAAGIAGSVYSSNKQSSATKRAADQQAQASANSLKEQQQEFNRANAQEADIGSLLESNMGGDQTATMLTGPSGVNRNQQTLGGGSSLLG